jgi:drug/metabolite transporter (DMT)-like permease
MPYLALVSIIWAFSFGLIGATLAGLDPYFIAVARLTLAFAFFLPFFRWKRLQSGDQWRLPFYGAVQFGVMYVAYIKAFAYLPSHLVALFSVLTPVYVVLIHSLRIREWSLRYLIAAILSVAGATIIRAKNEPDGSIWLGFVLMQIAGIAFAFGQVAYRDWKRDRPELKDRECFALLYGGGVTCALAFSLVMTDWSTVEISGKQSAALLYLGIVASGCGFFFWNKGAAQSSPGTLAAFNNAVVPLAVFCSLFIFGEIQDVSAEAGLRLFSGACLIAAAVWIGQKGESKLPNAKR